MKEFDERDVAIAQEIMAYADEIRRWREIVKVIGTGDVNFDPMLFMLWRINNDKEQRMQ